MCLYGNWEDGKKVRVPKAETEWEQEGEGREEAQEEMGWLHARCHEQGVAFS